MSTQAQSRNIVFLLMTALLIGHQIIYANQYAGQRLKITGRWNGKFVDGVRVQHRDGGKDPASGLVEGKIDSFNIKTMIVNIGPLRVKLIRETELNGLTGKDLQTGKSIKTSGKMAAGGHLLASAIEASDARAFVQILGYVTTGKRQPNGKIFMQILGVPIQVPLEVYDCGLSLIRNPDDKRPDQQLTLNVFGKPLTVGGEIGSAPSFRGDYELDDAGKDDQARFEQNFELELFYRAPENVAIFLEGKSSRETVVYDQDQKGPAERAITRGETWLFAGKGGVGLQIGRQNFREAREWWWDRNLDAARVYLSRRRLSLELGVAKDLGYSSTKYGKINPTEDGVVRLLGHSSWAWQRNHRLDLFFLRQKDRSSRYALNQIVAENREDESDANLQWLGARLTGDWKIGPAGNVNYWLDGATVHGEETAFGLDEDDNGNLFVDDVENSRVRGWALDGGLSWETKFPLRPTLSMGYALGSGDKNSNDGINRNFRQTGLHDNNNRFNGVDRFRYYGELYRPELSNIKILTGAFGFPILRSSSVELVYHRYRQFYPADEQRDARLKADPNGERVELGEEWNLVIGLEEWKRLEIELVGGMFRAGKAYGALAGEKAYNVLTKVDFNF
jgi:hypothetical protein